MSGHRAILRLGLPVLGLVGVLGGVAALFSSAGPMAEAGEVLGMVVGLLLLFLGFVMIVPAALALAGKTARRLPPAPRLAVLDAARNRGRTVPAVAAILAAAAGFTAVAIAGISEMRHDELYSRFYPTGTTIVGGLTARPAPEVRAVIERELPGVPIAQADGFDEYLEKTDQSLLSPVEGDTLCMSGSCSLKGWMHTQVLIADPETARILVGDAPSVASALAEGKVVVFLPGVVRNGLARFELTRFHEEDPPEILRTFDLPAVRATTGLRGAPSAIFPPEAAARTGLKSGSSALLIDAPISEEQSGRLDREMARIPYNDSHHYTERGSEEFSTELLVSGAAALLLVLGTALATTRPAAADARPDLDVLAAGGAKPGVRRLFLMSQAGFVCLLGCALGVLAGSAPGVAVAIAVTDLPPGEVKDGSDPGPLVALPWQLLLGTLVAVPLLASAVTALSVRGGQTLPERAAT